MVRTYSIRIVNPKKGVPGVGSFVVGLPKHVALQYLGVSFSVVVSGCDIVLVSGA